MIQVLWALMWGISLIAAFVHGSLESFSLSILDAGKQSIQIMIALAGALLFWMGLLRVAEAAGIISILARLMRPFLRIIFPSIPRNHPVFGWIASNISANMLGVGNAATPIGIQAMKELQTLNPHTHRPSAAMCTFVILNTAGVTLLPSTMISLRSTFGSSDPNGIIIPSLIVTATACISALLVDRLLQRVRGHSK